MNLVLASESKRRQQLLKLLNINFKVSPSNIDESKIIKNNYNPNLLCEKLAYLKAQKVKHLYPNDIIIGGDTIVVIKNEILGKPTSKDNAFKMLKKLNNRTHSVITGVSIQCKLKNISHTFHEITNVTFKKITKQDIEYYIEKCQPYDKAGSYGIQDWSAIFVKKIDGCFYNVVGFPISKFHYEFKKLGLYKLI